MACRQVSKGEANCIEMSGDRDKWCPSCTSAYVVLAPLPDDEDAPQEEL